jgi:site-specific DNA-methyltransferase (adenine-specific)
MSEQTAILSSFQDYTRSIRDKHFDLTVADPWYGIGMNRGGTGYMKNRHKKETIEDSPPTAADFKELKRISKHLIVWGGNYFCGTLGNCRAPIIWDKGTGANYFADGEMAWTSFRTGCLRIIHHQWCGCFKDSEQGEEAIHPCQKPVFLYRWIFSRFVKPGMIVFDPYMGSGSMRIAAAEMDIDYVGTERDSETFGKQEARWRAEQPRIRDVRSQLSLYVWKPKQKKLIEGAV